jgi:hypothetical protein
MHAMIDGTPVSSGTKGYTKELVTIVPAIHGDRLFVKWEDAAPTGVLLPKCCVPHAMPTHNRLRPDDCYGVKNAREAAIEPNEQGTVNPTQMQTAWGSMVQDIESMPQS